MGVDTSFAVRVFSADADEYKEIVISEQDNSLMSLFTHDLVKYTNILFDREEVLTKKENELLKLSDDYEDFEDDDFDDSEMTSTIMDGNIALAIFTKIRNKIDKEMIAVLPLHIEDELPGKAAGKPSLVVKEYLSFYSSLLLVQGVLKAAATFNQRVQLVANFY